MSATPRRLSLAGLAVAGVVCGIAVASLVGGGGSAANGDETPAAPTGASTTRATAPSSSAPPPVTAAAPAGPMLVWTTGGLPPGFADGIAAVPGVTGLTVVRGDDLDLDGTESAAGSPVSEVRPGWFIPLDALAVDLATYGRVVPGGDVVVAALTTPDSAVLGATSAELRGIGIGGRLTVGGAHELTVTAVVPDAVVAAAEVVVSLETGATIGVTTPRSVLVRYTGARSDVERGITAHRDGRQVRFREGAETAYLRHGDAVLPQALIKQRFGEFAARHRDGTWLELDPAWVAANIVEVDLPVLGRTRCHALVVPMVEGALAELANAGLTSLVDPADFGGCYAPRLIGTGLGVSRHAWGVAIDVNVAANPLGGTSRQDPRLVAVMRHWGLAWGGEWLRPDPMHFEYLSPPR
jgi:hypothetical protein